MYSYEQNEEALDGDQGGVDVRLPPKRLQGRLPNLSQLLPFLSFQPLPCCFQLWEFLIGNQLKDFTWRNFRETYVIVKSLICLFLHPGDVAFCDSLNFVTRAYSCAQNSLCT